MSRFKVMAAVHLFLISNEQILLLRRYNTGYEDGNYSVVAGHLDGGETIKAAIIREAKEEVGISLAIEDLTIIQVMHRLADDERIDYFLTANHWVGSITNLEPDKCDDLRWYSIDSLPKNLIPHVRAAITNYSQRKSFTDFGWHCN